MHLLFVRSYCFFIGIGRIPNLLSKIFLLMDSYMDSIRYAAPNGKMSCILTRNETGNAF